MTTNVPPVQFTSTGLVVPTEEAILNGVLADIDTAFGGGVNPGLTTPQGQLAMAEAAVIGNRDDELLAIVNNMDPAYSSGRYQDALGRIYNLVRSPALPSVVSCTCVGSPSTVIPPGTLATDGVNLWAAVDGGTIPIGGSIALSFACTVTGPIPAAIGAVNRIYKTVLGWDTITNPSEAVLGSDVENRANFEFRRQQTIEANSRSTIEAMVGEVLRVDGVTDAYGYANDTAGAETVSGVTLAAHEVYVAVQGGTDQLVGDALWRKKPPGSPWYSAADTSVTVQDTSNGYTPPYPTYTVKFERPAATPILFAVTMTDSAQVPADAQTLVRNAIVATFDGADGGDRARIGGTVYASRFYAGIVSLGSWAKLVSIKLGTVTATLDDVTLAINKIPTVAPSDITLTLV